MMKILTVSFLTLVFKNLPIELMGDILVNVIWLVDGYR